MNNPNLNEQTESADAGCVQRLVRWLAWINHRLDMLAYRVWWGRWKKKFVRQPEMLIPFMDTMTRWANEKLTPEQIAECREKWRMIAQKPPNDY